MDEDEVAWFASLENVGIAGGLVLGCDSLSNFWGYERLEARPAAWDTHEALGKRRRQM